MADPLSPSGAAEVVPFTLGAEATPVVEAQFTPAGEGSQVAVVAAGIQAAVAVGIQAVAAAVAAGDTTDQGAAAHNCRVDADLAS
jgi:hypothetical protein